MAFPELLTLCLATLPAVAPGTLWHAWSLAPEVLLPLLLLTALPWLLALAGRRSAPAADGPRSDRRRQGASQAWWLLGCLLLGVALISPLCRLAAVLASAHMAQHLLLVLLAPLAMAPFLCRMRRMPKLPPAAAVLLFAAAIWLAHAPPVYQAGLQEPLAHLALLAGVLGVALLFWTSALAADGFRALGMVFVTMLHSGLLGALLTFSSTLWYPAFGTGPDIWGLTPLEDQQLAGLIMWVPMGAALLVAGLAITATRLQALAGEPAGTR